MEGAEITEPPQKRVKIDNYAPSDEVVIDNAAAGTETSAAAPQACIGDAQALKEIEVGITEFVSPDNEGFAGILKKRYTDFLVNEILPSGEVLHLRNTEVPAILRPEKKEEDEEVPVSEPAGQPEETQEQQPFKITDEDKALLESYFGAEKSQAILNLHKRALASPKTRPGELGKIVTTVFTDRDLRTKIHQSIRRIFSSQLDSSTDGEGVMTITAAGNRNRRNPPSGRGGNNPRGGGSRPNWTELGGPYLHFSIYKENKDTMEVISFIARQMKMNPKSFQFAGTKDRRGVTVQRACAHRVHADRLARLNSTLRNAALGDFEYRKEKLELGDLNGNEFVITLRDCDISGVDPKADPDTAVAKATEIVGSSLRNLREKGYFNYYGLQRFGTFSTRTDTVGVKMLQGDFKGACEAILHFSPHVLAAAQNQNSDVDASSSTSNISTDDKARAEAIHIFNTTGRVADALDKLPRKFSAESNLIRHLARVKNDYIGALQAIPRNLRLMYVHAYQSLVWNVAAGERWRLYGNQVVEGDLVIINEHDNNNNDPTATRVDDDGEVIVVPTAEDSAYAADDMFTRARPLSAAEAASGKFSIFDIVLPLPGFDVLYPANAMTDFYKSFMASERGGRLDPFDMRRKWKDVSLSGGYRKVFSRMGPDYSFHVKLYSRDDEQFVRTDLDCLNNTNNNNNNNNDKPVDGAGAGAGDKLAVVLKFQLGSSQYATMALRELTKGKVKAYTPDFGGR